VTLDMLPAWQGGSHLAEEPGGTSADCRQHARFGRELPTRVDGGRSPTDECPYVAG